MAASDAAAAEISAGDGVSVRRWFAFYLLLVLAAGVPLVAMLSRQELSWDAWVNHTTRTFSASKSAVKLLGFGLYLSICCTFLPLPTGWIVAAVATREVAVTGELWSTVLLVAAVGAAASTVANLNDYHFLTWMLRSKRIARVRHSRSYQAAARWFSKGPFFILVIFNVIPIPVDIVRLLATTYRYPRVPFAAASFIGRFVRYGVIAFVTFWWDLSWIAVVTLLGLAIVLAGVRLVGIAIRKLIPRPAAAGTQEQRT